MVLVPLLLMAQRLREIHANDLQAVEEKQLKVVQASAADWPKRIGIAIQTFRQVPTPPEQLFCSYISPERWEKICSAHDDPTERGTALLREMAKLAPDVMSHKAVIRELFIDYYSVPSDEV